MNDMEPNNLSNNSHYLRLLKTFSSDIYIVVTQADKGHLIVILTPSPAAEIGQQC